VLDIEASENNVAAANSRTPTGNRRRKSTKKSPMERQAFLSTLPFRQKGRRRRTSTSTPKPDLSKSTIDHATQSAVEDADHDSNATSSDDELGKLVKAKRVDGTMTPTSLAPSSGFIGFSCGKDAPTVHYVSPLKGPTEIAPRPDFIAGDSRFYHKRRIKIGNTSKFIPEAKRSPKMAKYTHKWMIYFVSPAYSHPISTFLSSVTIFLDESFPLPRIIELRVPPFRWVSYGWGEFNLNIRLVFCDPARNKPMDVVHPLRLDPNRSGREVEGYTGYFDVDMDRNTVFLPGQPGLEFDEVPTMAQVEKEEIDQTSAVVPASIRSRPANPSISRSVSRATSERPSLSDRGSFSEETEIEGISDLDEDEVREVLGPIEPYFDYIRPSVERNPLISEQMIKVPYSIANCSLEFLSWTLGRRKSVEWQRARLVRSEVLDVLPAAFRKDASNDITIKSVVLWCRQNNYGPPVLGSAPGSPDDVLRYCRFCGMLEDAAPKKGRKKSLSLGVDSYCCCGRGFKQQLAMMKTSSSVQDMINRNKSHSAKNTPVTTDLDSQKLRNLLAEVDVNVMRWVWRSVLQLQLSGTEAHRNEDVSQMNDEGPLNAMAVMTHATNLFLSRLIQRVRSHSRGQAADDDDEVVIVGTTSKADASTRPLIVTPIHILKAIREATGYDFLTNAGTATGSS
jgi:hypothetical protein